MGAGNKTPEPVERQACHHPVASAFLLSAASDRTPRVSSGPAWAAREKTRKTRCRALSPVERGEQGAIGEIRNGA